MKTTRLTTCTALLSALILSACGGNNDSSTTTPVATKPNFTAFVTFGDSLSDVGTYAPATSLAGNGSAPYFGGKFTTNNASGTVWVENLAATLHLTVTPAEVGFNGASVKCPAAAASALAATCTALWPGWGPRDQPGRHRQKCRWLGCAHGAHRHSDCKPSGPLYGVQAE